MSATGIGFGRGSQSRARLWGRFSERLHLCECVCWELQRLHLLRPLERGQGRGGDLARWRRGVRIEHDKSTP
ncbi:MAG: hypothetical protein RL701_1428, partial [Pseudomonadota bacterium]